MGIVTKDEKNFDSRTIQHRNLPTRLATDGAPPAATEAPKPERDGQSTRENPRRSFYALTTREIPKLDSFISELHTTSNDFQSGNRIFPVRPGPSLSHRPRKATTSLIAESGNKVYTGNRGSASVRAVQCPRSRPPVVRFFSTTMTAGFVPVSPGSQAPCQKAGLTQLGSSPRRVAE